MKQIVTLLAFAGVLVGLTGAWVHAGQAQRESASERLGTTTVQHLGDRS
jgi:hypothetical protein